MTKKTVKAARVDAALDNEISTYALATGLTQSEALRKLIEQGLASWSGSKRAPCCKGAHRDAVHHASISA